MRSPAPAPPKPPVELGPTRAGTVAIVGRPNVGKSTLLNAALEQPLSIVSPAPQTTRDAILGVVRRGRAEIALLDTPGLHRARSELGRVMNQTAREAARSADVVVFLAEVPSAPARRLENSALAPHPGDVTLLADLGEGRPTILVLNKIDRAKDKSVLLPLIEAYAKVRSFSAVVPVCALKPDAAGRVLDEVARLLPEGPWRQGEDDLTDRPVRFFAAEYVREQILAATEAEVPHAVAITVDRFVEPVDGAGGCVHIDATICVERPGQKRILIGTGGEMLKNIGTRARKRIQELTGRKVNLKLWVRVSPAWRQSRAQLEELGYRSPAAAGSIAVVELRRPGAARRRRRRGSVMSSGAIVALVGRPNVGKSTLFNRLVGKKVAIVHDEPGVTRDRHYGDVESRGRRYTLIDTGGFDPESEDPMRQGIRRQVEIAIAEADVIVCVLDATASTAPADHAEVALLRRADKPVIFIANKADNPRLEAESADLYRLGIKDLVQVSALHGRGVDALEAAIDAALPPPPAEAPAPAEGGAVTIAVIGRPNAGKSSLVNRLSGEERVLVDARPGTTRDPIDLPIERDGKRFVLIDTAGIRRKAKVAKEHDVVEAISVMHAIRSMDRGEVALLMCDAAEGVAEQDAKILGLAVDRGRAAIVIVLNKIDLLDKKQLAKVEADARDKLSFAPWAPIVHVSAVTGRGMGGLFDTLGRVAEAYRRRVPTGELNRFFEAVLVTHPPPTSGGKAPRVFYITQAETSPPLFVVVASDPEKLHFSYQRYVTNQLRKTFGFEGVPVRVKYKARRRRDLKKELKR